MQKILTEWRKYLTEAEFLDIAGDFAASSQKKFIDEKAELEKIHGPFDATHLMQVTTEHPKFAGRTYIKIPNSCTPPEKTTDNVERCNYSVLIPPETKLAPTPPEVPVPQRRPAVTAQRAPRRPPEVPKIEKIKEEIKKMEDEVFSKKVGFRYKKVFTYKSRTGANSTAMKYPNTITVGDGYGDPYRDKDIKTTIGIGRLVKSRSTKTKLSWFALNRIIKYELGGVASYADSSGREYGYYKGRRIFKVLWADLSVGQEASPTDINMRYSKCSAGMREEEDGVWRGYKGHRNKAGEWIPQPGKPHSHARTIECWPSGIKHADYLDMSQPAIRKWYYKGRKIYRKYFKLKKELRELEILIVK